MPQNREGGALQIVDIGDGSDKLDLNVLGQQHANQHVAVEPSSLSSILFRPIDSFNIMTKTMVAMVVPNVMSFIEQLPVVTVKQR